MPKRVGYLYERVLTLDNCTEAVLIGTRNLRKNRKIRYIRANAEKYGAKILGILQSGWSPRPTRHKIINEGTGRKVRELEIPTTLDHLIHVAIMLPLIPYLEKRFDYYSCGSIKGRGQKRVDNALKGWLSKGVCYRYAGEADIHHAYEATNPKIVMDCLYRICKDKRYLRWHQMILNQMGDHLAIGFMPSHWYFNLVMDQVDKKIRSSGLKIRYVRFMDNLLWLSNRKSTCHQALQFIKLACQALGYELNRNYQVYPTYTRPVQMLSYKYYPGYSVLRKPVMKRIKHMAKTAAKKPCAHHARSMMSLLGLVRHCKSYIFRLKYVYPGLNLRRQKELISIADQKCGSIVAA